VDILTFIGGLCCVGFIHPSDIVAGVQKQRLVLSVGPPEDES
jgi:hypothetical protein